MFLINLYYIFVAVSIPYYFYKNGINKISIFLFLVFWQGLFQYLGQETLNLLKIVTVIYAIFLFNRRIFENYNFSQRRVGFYFLLFTIFFWISYGYNGGEIITIFSQYFYKYGLVFLIYNGFLRYSKEGKDFNLVKKTLLSIIFIQITLSVIKLFIFGFEYEKIVGSVSFGGAGLAVVVPLVGVIFYWVIRDGRFRRWDYVRVLSLFLIPLASGKRAPVVIFPLLVILLFYIRGHWNLSSILKLSPIVILVFVIGVKLTPSLNPENEIWGSFDANHLIKYSIFYNFGTSDISDILDENYASQGRGGSLLLLANPGNTGLSNLVELLFGKGLYEVAVAEQGRFIGNNYQGMEHEGLASEVILVVYTLGFGGLITMILVSFSILNTIKDKRLFVLLFGLYIWEFFLYYNQVVFSGASSTILLYAIHHRNRELSKD